MTTDCERCMTNQHIASVLAARINALNAIMAHLAIQISHLGDMHEDLVLGMQT